MNSSTLVISDDLILRSEVRALMVTMDVACTCSGVVGFKRIIESSKFDSIIIDVGHGAETVKAVEVIRTGRLNRYAVIFALVVDGQSESSAWRAGANFTIRRSASLKEDLNRTFESAHGLIVREKRRYHRHPVNLEVEIECNGNTMSARMLDISERGACLESEFPVPTRPVQLRFLLPGLRQKLKVEALPTWSHAGKVGVQFNLRTELFRSILAEWLTARTLQVSGI